MITPARTWSDGPSGGTPINAERLNGMEQDIAKARSLFFDVTDYGAIGNGVFDCTPSVALAVSACKLAGGGSILFPPGGDYNMPGLPVTVSSNMRIIAWNAIIRKPATPLSYSVFVTLSNGTTGYGSGGKGIVFAGGTYRGSFASDTSQGISITLHHAQNVVFDGVIFEEAILAGHAIDLGGCKKVKIKQCVFNGWRKIAGREYTEAIQLDYSTALGIGTESNMASYDGLPTIDVIVDDCEFSPLVIGGTTYPAPNPLGGHGAVQNQRVRNITFKRNTVTGGIGTDGFGTGIRGWLHSFQADNFKIENNVFNNTTGASAIVVGILTAQNGIALADVGNPAATNVSIPVQPVTGLKIRNNEFNGFKGTVSSENPICVYGISSAKLNGVIVEGNEIRDSHPTNTNGTGGIFFALIQYAKNVRIGINFGSDLRGVATILDSDSITYSGNMFENTRDVFGRITNSTVVSISDNKSASSAAGMYLSGVSDLIINHNRIEVSVTPAFNMTGCSNFMVTKNSLKAVGTISEGISMWNICNKGRVTDNFILGSFTTPVVNTGSNIDVTVSGTVT